MVRGTAPGAITLTDRRDPGPFPRGRICRSPGCITVLTTHNPGPDCFTHTLHAPPVLSDVAELQRLMEQRT